MMKTGGIRFLVALSCLVALLSGLTYLLNDSIPQFITSYWSLLILFFTIISIVVYFLTIKVKAKNDIHKFTNFYMAVTVIKLLVYLAVIVIYSLKFPENSKAFIITFLAYYLCFSVFETYILVKKK